MERARYTAVAIVLHWAIALAILFNIGLGWWMHEAIEDRDTAARAIIAYQAHKSIGLTVLALSLVRLGWRLTHKPPPLPAAMPAWEAFAARATHWAFYGLMIALPLSGWLYVSTGWSAENDAPLVVPTLYFGLFEVPHLFGLQQASEAVRADLAEITLEAHELFVFAALGLAALHVGAALKHWLIDRDGVLPQMAPGLPVLGAHEAAPVAEPRRRAALIAGFALIALGALGIGAALTQPIAAAPARVETAPAADEQAEDVAEDAADVEEILGEANSGEAGPPPAWTVDRAQSAIRFSGEHAGVPFNGAFSRWRADIRFDPKNPGASSALVTIETASASDGVALHDQSLPGAEWFDVNAHPTATFRTTRIRARGEDAYEARGVLTIKGKEIDLDLPFTLTIAGDRARMSGRATIDRREADLGMRSDPDAAYVSRDILVDVRVEAVRGPISAP